CGRAEIAFILASLALAQGAIDQSAFTVLVFTAFLLNLFTPFALKGCAVLLQGKAAHQVDATRGVVQIDKFSEPLVEERYEGQLLHELPDMEDAVAIYGYGPEVASLMAELDSRGVPMVVIEEDEIVARRLQARSVKVVNASLAGGDLDLKALNKARALVANGDDEYNALLAVSARELGFGGPIVALVDNPNRRAALQLAGATTAFTPNHILAAAVAVRASARIGPRITGVQPLGNLLEVVEIRVHDKSPFAHKTLENSGILTDTGVHIVGQWVDHALHAAPAAEQALKPGMILVAAGSPDSIKRLSEIARPITKEGRIVVAGFGDVGSKLVEMLKDAEEEVCVIDKTKRPEVDVVGDVIETGVLERAEVTAARVVVLACENDSATLLAATVVRDYAPDVPIIACVALEDNVARIQQAGADSALSVSRVAGQLLAHHILGEMVSQQAHIKLVKRTAGRLVGRRPMDPGIREQTRCAIIAIEHAGEVVMDLPPSLVIAKGDELYVCGTVDDLNRFYETFGEPSI
ncbi:MAG: TrkA family potassium uptake protein, partial [Gammaproteobacteria bacterium]